MPETRSLTTEKSLIVQLQPLICCSESQSTCMDNEFCSSNPADWPTTANGKAMVKMSYPEGEEDETLQGIGGFCDAYIDWNMRTGCAGIAADTVKELSAGSRQQAAPRKPRSGIFALFMPDPNKDQCPAQLSDTEERIARSREALEGKCTVMYSDRNGQPEFDKRKAEDLKNIADLCLTVNKDKDDAGTGLWGLITGSGIVSVIIFLFWIFRKLVRVSRGGMNAMGDAAYITQGVSEMLRPVTTSLRHLFGVDMPNFLRAVRYIVTLGWLRGRSLPAEIPLPVTPPANQATAAVANPETSVPPSQTALPPEVPPIIENAAMPAVPPAVHDEATAETPPVQSAVSAGPDAQALSDTAALHQPHPDVVHAQLETLGEHEGYRTEGDNFLTLSKEAQVYMAYLAVTRWNTEPIGTRRIYLEEDTRLTEGKLPRQYLMRFARQFLRRGSTLSILERSARLWVENGGHRIPEDRGGPVSPSDFEPRPIDVKRQMISSSDFTNATPEAQDYLVRMAISEWEMTSRETQADFISDSDVPEMGTLPTKFIRFFRRNLSKSMKEVETKARMFTIIEAQVPDMIGKPFHYIDIRIQQVVAAWSYLPRSIQNEFRQLARDSKDRKRGSLPFEFAEYMMKVSSIGTIARLPTHISTTPWTYEGPADIRYQGYDPHDVMQKLAALNEMFPFYPDLLRSRATSVIDSWTLLPQQRIREEFTNVDRGGTSHAEPTADAVEEGIPMSFVEFMHKSNSGIGTDRRKGIKGTGGGSSSGEGKPGSGTPPAVGSSGSGVGFGPSSMQGMGSSRPGRVAMTAVPPPVDQMAYGLATLHHGLPATAPNSAALAQATLQMYVAAAITSAQSAGSAIMAMAAGSIR